jgi:hypothetical protein
MLRMIKYFFIRTIYNGSNPFHTVVLTAAQTTAFFENEDQMGIPHATVVQLTKKGITNLLKWRIILTNFVLFVIFIRMVLNQGNLPFDMPKQCSEMILRLACFPLNCSCCCGMD